MNHVYFLDQNLSMIIRLDAPSLCLSPNSYILGKFLSLILKKKKKTTSSVSCSEAVSFLSSFLY